MNSKKIIFTALMAASLLLYQSCSKIEEFGNINQNPNATTEPNTAGLLTNALAGIGNNLAWDQGGISTVAGLYAQLFSETQYTEASRYAKPTFNFDGYYRGVLFDLKNIDSFNTIQPERAAINGSNNDQKAIARILKAYYFFFLTSMYGDIPYFQALQGNGDIPYDPQQSILADLIKELKEANAQFDGGTPVRGDILFGGDESRWKKFANSIRLLIALQMAKKDPATGQTEFNSALNDPAGVISSNAENATIVYPGGNFNSPGYNYEYITQRDDYAVSETVTDQLTATSDPRITALGSSKPDANGDVTYGVGFPYGLTRDAAVAFANANTDFARVLAEAYKQPESEVVLIGAANIYLARAEAAQRGWTSDVVLTMYNTGIQLSFEQWGVYSAGSYGAFITNPNIVLTPGAELENIATQEWLAWFPVGWQAFNLWRRTGFPVLAVAPGSTTPIPRRFPYGPNEYNLNPDNVAAAADLYVVGGVSDSQFAPVWFDQ